MKNFNIIAKFPNGYSIIPARNVRCDIQEMLNATAPRGNSISLLEECDMITNVVKQGKDYHMVWCGDGRNLVVYSDRADADIAALGMPETMIFFSESSNLWEICE